MARLLILLLLVAAGVRPGFAATDMRAALEIGAVAGSDARSYLRGGLGKAPFDASSEGLAVLDGFLEAQGDIGSVWDYKVTATVSDQLDPLLGISEATLTYRPLPVSGYRVRFKVGAFRPPVSFEHEAEGWASEHMVSASAINSWIGQEIGGLGVEAKFGSDPASHDGPLDWDVFVARFGANDTSGTLLAWSGWSFWQSQSRWGDRIPLSDLELLEYVPYQAHVAEPFLETDGRLGFWAGGTIGRAGLFRVRAVHYDNEADPNSQANGQWGWHTRFDSLGMEWNLPGQVGVTAQWLTGRTDTWEVPVIGAVVDADFDSYFAGLTKRLGERMFTLRYDHFGIDDRDRNPIDPNGENGHAWTASYQQPVAKHWDLTLEAARIESDRPARELQGLPANEDERLAYLTLTWRL